MKITGTRTQLVELPADEPLAGAAENPSGKRPIVTLRVQTDEGVEGVGVSYFGGALDRKFAHATDQLGPPCVGGGPVVVGEGEQEVRKPAGRAGGPRGAEGGGGGGWGGRGGGGGAAGGVAGGRARGRAGPRRAGLRADPGRGGGG